MRACCAHKKSMSIHALTHNAHAKFACVHYCQSAICEKTSCKHDVHAYTYIRLYEFVFAHIGRMRSMHAYVYASFWRVLIMTNSRAMIHYYACIPCMCVLYENMDHSIHVCKVCTHLCINV